MRARGIIVAILVSGCAMPNANLAVLDQIERQVTLPKDADPLDRYDRFYTRVAQSSEIVGVYRAIDKDRPATRKFVEASELPQIEDGGCSVINLRYSTVAKRITSISCNGFA